MKKYSVIAIALVFVLSACNNSNNTAPETTAPGTPAVQNVNGNLPDTTNSINLNETQRADSLPKGDTTVHH